MKSRFSLFFAAAFAAIFVFAGILGSCQSYDAPIREPRVSINSVDIAGINFSGADLIVNVGVQNLNRFALPMPNIAWELFIGTGSDAVSFLQGNLPNSQSIAGRRRVTVSVPVHVTFEGLYRAFVSLVEDREAAYNIALAISFPLPIVGDKVFNLDFSGALPLPQLPELSFRQVNVSRFDFFGTDLSLEIDILNTNSFPIAFPDINWNYAVNGIPVVTSSFAGSGQGLIAAGAARNANIDITLMYADILRVAGSAMNAAGEVAGDFFVGMNLADMGLPQTVLETAAAQSILNIPASIPVLRKPEVSFGGITRRSLGFMRMEFALNIHVDNQNNFAFDINEFNYEVRVNNHLWIQSRTEEPVRIAANSRIVIPMNAVITTPAMVEELVTVLSQGLAVNYILTGNMDIQPERQGLERLELPLNVAGSSRIF